MMLIKACRGKQCVGVGGSKHVPDVGRESGSGVETGETTAKERGAGVS